MPTIEPTDERGKLNKPTKPWQKALGMYMAESTLTKK